MLIKWVTSCGAGSQHEGARAEHGGANHNVRGEGGTCAMPYQRNETAKELR